MNSIDYLYNDKDYSNAEPEELVSGFRSIVYKIKRSWTKHKNEYEKIRATISNQTNELLGKSLQLMRTVFKNIDPSIHRGAPNQDMIKLLSDKGAEAEALISGLKKNKDKKYNNRSAIINSLLEVVKLKSIAQGFNNMRRLEIDCFGLQPKSFQIKIRDRDVLINSYLIARPQATGINYEFLNHVIQLDSGSCVELKNLPTWLTGILNSRVDKRFGKILNDLNIRGSIRKVFFPQVKDDSLHFRGHTVLRSTIEKEGINVKVLIEELEKIHLSNDKIR